MNIDDTIEQMQIMADLAPCGIGLFDLETSVPIFLNKAYYDLIGYTKEEYTEFMLDKEYLMFPQDIEISHQTAREYEQLGEINGYEYRIVRKDGKIRWVKLNVSTIELKEKKYAFTSFTDITKEKETYIQLEMITENTNSSVSMLRIREGKEDLVYANNQFFELIGLSRTRYLENIHYYSTSLISQEDQIRIKEAVREAYINNRPGEIEHILYKENGKFIWVRRRFRVIKQAEPDTYMILSIVTDITEQRNEEHQQNVKLTNLLNELPGGVGIFIFAKTLQCEYYSDGFARMAGLTREEMDERIRNNTVLSSIIAPMDYPVISRKIKELSSQGLPMNLNYRYLYSDGSVRWLHLSASQLSKKDGYPVYYCIFTTPTEESEIYRNVVEDSAIGVFIASRENRSIHYMNNMCKQLCGMPGDTKATGYTAYDLLGKNGKRVLLTKEQLNSLKDDCYSQFYIDRNGKYLAVKAKAILWNGTDSYILYITDETDEHRHLLELQETRIKEQTLMNSIPGGVAIYRLKRNGDIYPEYISDGLAKISGYSSGEKFKAVLKNNAMVNVVEKDISIVYEAVKKSLEDHKPISIIYRIHQKGHLDIMNRLDANLIENAKLEEDDVAVWYAVHTLVSPESQMAILEQAHYRSVLDMLGIAYWEWSKDGGFYTSSNFVKYAISDASLEEMRQNLVQKNVVHEDDIPLLKKFFEYGERKDAKASVTLRLLMKDGTYHFTELLGFKEYAEDGSALRMSCTLRDVNEEWLEQKKNLQEALDAAQNANQAKSAFLSRMSHDMRTPLNGMLGLANLMKGYTTDSKLLEDLAQFELSGQYLLNLINDTLDVSRIETGNLQLHPSVCEGRNIFNNVIALAKPIAKAKNIQIAVETKGLTYPMLYIDIGRVEQIMMNILSNAVKFTQEGGHIVCGMTNLSFEKGIVTDQVVIKDDGIGMSKEFLPHIFEPFSQEDNSKKNSRQGTGLGMIITKQLVEAMGGSISVESEQGVGTSVTFTLVMPIATPEQIEEWKGTIKEKVQEDVLKGSHILLCEDHPLNAEITKRLLGEKEVLLDHAENGKVGLEMFQTSPVGYYDAILMDVRMPVMDGMETTVEIRKLDRPDAGKIPIIAMTANAFEEDRKQSSQAGMDAHLSKPINPQELYDTLSEKILKNRQD